MSIQQHKWMVTKPLSPDILMPFCYSAQRTRGGEQKQESKGTFKNSPQQSPPYIRNITNDIARLCATVAGERENNVLATKFSELVGRFLGRAWHFQNTDTKWWNKNITACHTQGLPWSLETHVQDIAFLQRFQYNYESQIFFSVSWPTFWCDCR